MEYKTNSLSEIAEQYIKEQVLSAKLKSGDKIIEKDISDALEISRAPVREALSTLRQQGLVDFLPRRGHFIIEMDRSELFEVFQIRISLELEILKIIIWEDLLGSKDYKYLYSLSEKMRRAKKVGSNKNEAVFKLNSLDIEFHRYLWKKSKSKRRAQLLEGLFFQLVIIMNNDISAFGTNEEKADEHVSLVKALETKDMDLVCQKFEKHFDNYVRTTLGELSELEDEIFRILFYSQ